MRALSIVGAKHFTAGFSSAVAPRISTLRYVTRTSTPSRFVEGTQTFGELRAAMLRDADRYIFLAGSNFVRSIDVLRPSSSAWSVVGLYYASWYSAHAILGMLGCWVSRPDLWIDVVNTNPGTQELELHRRRYAPRGGSHNVFWNAYYSAVGSLANVLSPAAARALRPMSSNRQWFIQLRNKVNYEPDEALALMARFEASYATAPIPRCFPGQLNSAHQMARNFLVALRELSLFTSLGTDVFLGSVDRKSAVRAKINGAPSTSMASFARTEQSICEF